MADADDEQHRGQHPAGWEHVLDRWRRELADRPGEVTWVTLAEAEAQSGASRSALRSWYRTGQVPSRMIDGPHGPQRLVPLETVVARAAQSPRIARKAGPALGTLRTLDALSHRVAQLEAAQEALLERLSALEEARSGPPAR